jgi:hypothetical protein
MDRKEDECFHCHFWTFASGCSLYVPSRSRSSNPYSVATMTSLLIRRSSRLLGVCLTCATASPSTQDQVDYVIYTLAVLDLCENGRPAFSVLRVR